MERLTIAYAYPCSVNQGFPLELLISEICTRNNLEEAKNELRQTLENDFNLFQDGGADMRQRINEAETEDDLVELAHILSKEKFLQDNTYMKDDWQQIPDVYGQSSNYCTEYTTEKVDTLLSRIRSPNIGETTLLVYIIGHGLSQRGATHIQQHGFYFRVNPHNIGNVFHTTQEEAKNNAERGNIIVFSNGLLAPRYVQEAIQDRDGNEKEQQTEVIIVLDSCFSGTWVRYFQENEMQLTRTKVAIQASCGENETCRGRAFMPYFLQYQGNDNEENNVPVELHPIQTPCYWKSNPNDNYALQLMNADTFKNQCFHPTLQLVIPENGLNDFYNGCQIVASMYTTTATAEEGLAILFATYNNKCYEINLHFQIGEPVSQDTLTAVSHILYENGFQKMAAPLKQVHVVDNARDFASRVLEFVPPMINYPEYWDEREAVLAPIGARSRAQVLQRAMGNNL